jgi:hypothetical protein
LILNSLDKLNELEIRSSLKSSPGKSNELLEHIHFYQTLGANGGNEIIKRLSPIEIFDITVLPRKDHQERSTDVMEKEATQNLRSHDKAVLNSEQVKHLFGENILLDNAASNFNELIQSLTRIAQLHPDARTTETDHFLSTFLQQAQENKQIMKHIFQRTFYSIPIFCILHGIVSLCNDQTKHRFDDLVNSIIRSCDHRQSKLLFFLKSISTSIRQTLPTSSGELLLELQNNKSQIDWFRLIHHIEHLTNEETHQRDFTTNFIQSLFQELIAANSPICQETVDYVIQKYIWIQQVNNVPHSQLFDNLMALLVSLLDHHLQDRAQFNYFLGFLMDWLVIIDPEISHQRILQLIFAKSDHNISHFSFLLSTLLHGASWKKLDEHCAQLIVYDEKVNPPF